MLKGGVKSKIDATFQSQASCTMTLWTDATCWHCGLSQDIGAKDDKANGYL